MLASSNGQDKSKLPEKWAWDWALILQLCSVYIMLTIISKSATVHNGVQCAQKETIAIVQL